MPEFIAIGEARRHIVTVAKSLTINPGSIVAMDRAYNDLLEDQIVRRNQRKLLAFGIRERVGRARIQQIRRNRNLPGAVLLTNDSRLVAVGWEMHCAPINITRQSEPRFTHRIYKYDSFSFFTFPLNLKNQEVDQNFQM